jgi:hypothetical protein
MAVRSYRDLIAWQRGMDMAVEVYQATALPNHSAEASLSRAMAVSGVSPNADRRPRYDPAGASVSGGPSVIRLELAACGLWLSDLRLQLAACSLPLTMRHVH